MNKTFLIPSQSISELNLENTILIDVRSPIEFKDFSIPSSINIPVFTDQERMQVGRLYKQEGKEKAIKTGLSIFSLKIPRIFEQIDELQKEFPSKEIVVVCARGGMRSRSLVTILNTLGLVSYQLEGGIRSYRTQVTEIMAQFSLKPKLFYVISGNTGTRKTDVLQRLKLEGYPVIDLEGLCGHRGSVVGDIGQNPCSQKQFEARLVSELQRYQDSPFYVIESESKRIGNVIIPDFIMDGKKTGITIELQYPLHKRVEHLLETYDPLKNHERIKEAFFVIKKRLQGHIGMEIENAINEQNYSHAFELLLCHYYDPMYHHAFSKYQPVKYKVQFEELYEAVSGVKETIDNENKSAYYKGMV